MEQGQQETRDANKWESAQSGEVITDDSCLEKEERAASQGKRSVKQSLKWET
jgi:hypothetical protein